MLRKIFSESETIRAYIGSILANSFNRKGIADEQLAKVEMERERGRKRERQSEDPEGVARKRLRSESSTSSVSTISTAMSRSRSPTPKQTSREDKSNSPMRGIIRTRSPARSRSPPHVAARLSDGVKRRRESISSVDSYSSADDQGPRRGESGRERTNSRSTRRRYQKRSPSARGRQTESRTPPPRARRPLSNNRQNGKSSEVTAGKESFLRRERSLSPFSKRLALTQAMSRVER